MLLSSYDMQSTHTQAIHCINYSNNILNLHTKIVALVESRRATNKSSTCQTVAISPCNTIVLLHETAVHHQRICRELQSYSNFYEYLLM